MTYDSITDDPLDPPVSLDEATVEDTPIPPELETDFNFLCGVAGTGKTWLARAIVAQRPGTLLCATTGIAAVNLGEGTTINAALGYFDSASLVEAYTSGFLLSRLRKLHKAGVKRLLVDEVSMLDAQQLTIFVRALEELAGRGYGLDPSIVDEIAYEEGTEGIEPDARPLPIKLTIVGDFAQLPPVKAEYAFTSPEWEKVAASTLKLTAIRRQADPAFIAALMAARSGDAEEVAAYFAPRLASTTDNDFPGTTLVATNEAVDRFNALRMDTLKTAARVFSSRRWGKQRGDWKNIPERIVLKPGALVMLLANRREPRRPEQMLPGRIIYANGDLGEILALDPDRERVWVRLQRSGEEVEIEWITRDNRMPLEPGRAKELRDQGREDRIGEDAHGRARWEIVGGVTYLPVRVAYATTIHKSQGLSLDTVQVNTREGFFKTPGMLYVALSRARTAEGLRLVGSVDGLKTRCAIHAAVKPWL